LFSPIQLNAPSRDKGLRRTCFDDADVGSIADVFTRVAVFSSAVAVSKATVFSSAAAQPLPHCKTDVFRQSLSHQSLLPPNHRRTVTLMSFAIAESSIAAAALITDAVKRCRANH